MHAQPSAALKPRILKSIQAEFVRSEYPGTNESGVRPIGTSVLVLMDLVSQQTTGGIHLPPEKIEQMDMASETGVIVALGEAAFRYYGDGTKWTGAAPVPGDRVFVERYAGRQVMGRDQRQYRLMEYTCVAGIEEASSDQPTEKV